jgi:hypothetical protein
MRSLQTKDYKVRVRKDDGVFHEVSSAELMPGDVIQI